MKKSAACKLRGIARIAQRRLAQIGRLHLARAIVARAQLLDPLAVDIEADHRSARARKGRGDRQADIAEPDHGNLAVVLHHVVPSREPIFRCEATERPTLTQY